MRSSQEFASTIDEAEIEKFSKLADLWWDETGPFKPLHVFNPIRLQYIRDTVLAHFGRELKPQPLEGLSLIDIGCGGGLLAEPLTRMGAKVTAIDASEKNIAVAKLHASRSNLAIDYHCTTAEAMAAIIPITNQGLALEGANIQTKMGAAERPPNKYDIVLAMEIIEHVADVDAFLQACSTLVAPGGLLFIATLNRTAKSLLLAKFGAEYVLRWLPRGTHDWRKFLKPSEIVQPLATLGLETHAVQGMSFNLFSNSWNLSGDLSMNYVVVAKKP